jgi:hypothetical protein
MLQSKETFRLTNHKQMPNLKSTMQERKERIERRLKDHGIPDTAITYLRYLMFDDKKFATPREVGCRIMIIYTLVYTIEEPKKKLAAINWLKKENLWQHVSPNEVLYLESSHTEQEQINELSWQLEAAYILAWALGLVKENPSPDIPVTDEQMEEMFNIIPPIGENLQEFLNGLNYRKTEEVFDENIFYELTTAHFRDLYFNQKEDATNINKNSAFQRHKALNWLRRFMDITEWDETDMST